MDTHSLNTCFLDPAYIQINMLKCATGQLCNCIHQCLFKHQQANNHIQLLAQYYRNGSWCRSCSYMKAGKDGSLPLNLSPHFWQDFISTQSLLFFLCRVSEQNQPRCREDEDELERERERVRRGGEGEKETQKMGGLSLSERKVAITEKCPPSVTTHATK